LYVFYRGSFRRTSTGTILSEVTLCYALGNLFDKDFFISLALQTICTKDERSLIHLSTRKFHSILIFNSSNSSLDLLYHVLLFVGLSCGTLLLLDDHTRKPLEEDSLINILGKLKKDSLVVIVPLSNCQCS
jgi:hypothetical protein